MADYNQREHMEQVHSEGGSVYYKGAIIPPGHELPAASVLAKGNTANEQAAREGLLRERAKIDGELAVLDAAPSPASPALAAPEPAAKANAKK